MKFSFSTKGWKGCTWDDFCRMAREYSFSGIELHDIDDAVFTGAAGPLAESRKTVRQMVDMGMKIPCIDALCDIADDKCTDQSIKELERCIDAAVKLRVPYVRVHAGGTIDSPDSADAAVRAILDKAIPCAESAGIILLIETYGIFADSKRLREILNYFACDGVAALWDLQHPYRMNGESAEVTITNLGAYVKHVHIKDSEGENGDTKYCLMGEGTLPISEMMDALRSVNYDGFISLEWDPQWFQELDDPDIVFPQFISYMSRFDGLARGHSMLYSNNAGTGKFVWKKETIIDYTFSEILDRMVEEFPDQYAIKCTTLDYTRTYAEFRNDVDEFARSLISLGVKPGDKVSIWATNVPQWFITFWAATKIGAVLVTVNTAYKIHEAEYLFRQSDTHTLVMIDGYRDSDYASIINEICPELETGEPGKPLHCSRLPFLRNIITVGFKQKGCLTWDESLKYADKTPIEEVRRRASNVNSHDVANMQYTSGTTGFPKGVMLTHHNIVNNGKCIGDRMDLSTADRMLVHVPMFHCFGMVLSMTSCMTHGSTICPLPYYSPKAALACINQERITACNGVPTMFIAMLEHEDFGNTDFSYMRTGIMAGSPCPIAVMQDVVDKMNMKEITIVYGQTESSPGCTMSHSDDPLEVRVSTVGSNLPEIECKIVDAETGEDLPDNVDGEFCARGYNIMKGYYKMPAATASAIDKDGWLHTGDVARRDENGNFKITGRMKDMIIRGGENIYPKEIEDFIYTHPKVSDVQVIGVPDEQYGEEIMACVIMKTDEQMTEDEMKEYVRSHMAKHKTPRYVAFVDEFPMNAAGKILKYKMREDAVKSLSLDKANSIETA